MKLELVETVNDLKWGDYFEVKKDGHCVRTFFYGDTITQTRKKSLEDATNFYNEIKSGK